MLEVATYIAVAATAYAAARPHRQILARAITGILAALGGGTIIRVLAYRDIPAWVADPALGVWAVVGVVAAVWFELPSRAVARIDQVATVTVIGLALHGAIARDVPVAALPLIGACAGFGGGLLARVVARGFALTSVESPSADHR